jgi:hypothetical protein
LGRRFAILGPRDTYRYVELAGAEAVPPGADFDGIVIGDQVGFPSSNPSMPCFHGYSRNSIAVRVRR